MLKDALSKMPTVFPPQILKRGLEYHVKGHVLNVRLSDGLLKARIKGQSNHIYDVHIDLKRWPQQASRCTCPFESNCKHAVASLLALQVKERVSDSMQWLDWVQTVVVEPAKNKDNAQYIFYLLSLRLDTDNHYSLHVNLASAKKSKKGGFGKKTIIRSITASKKDLFTDNDETIIASLLFKTGYSDGFFADMHLKDVKLLEEILKTGRVFWEESDELCAWGAPLEAKPFWHMLPNGAQQMLFIPDYHEAVALFLDKLCYVDKLNDTIGLLESSLDEKILHALALAPIVSIDEASIVAEKMRALGPAWPIPNTFDNAQLKVVDPVPVISFNAVNLPYAHNQSTLFFYHIAFDYDGYEILEANPQSSVVVMDKNQVYVIKRQPDNEAALIQQIKTIVPGRLISTDERTALAIEDEAEWLEESQNCPRYVLTEIIHDVDMTKLYQQYKPALEVLPAKVVFLNEAYHEMIDADTLEWFSDLDEGGTQFFSYQLGIMIEGRAVSIVPLVANLIQKHALADLEKRDDLEKVSLSYEPGKKLKVTLGRIKPLIRLIFQLGIKSIDEEQKIQLSRYQLLLLKEIELADLKLQKRWLNLGHIEKQLQRLVQTDLSANISPPKSLTTTLRDYQIQGLTWLQLLREANFSGVLADDMGLGKTVQTLAHLAVEKEAGRMTKPSLIIAPTSLVMNWFSEALKFTPNLNVLVFHGNERHKDDFSQYDLIVSTYGLIQRDKTRFLAEPFYYLILDEAQFIKNARTKTTQVIHQIEAKHRLCLTGTPLENHLGELWSLFHFLMPGLLGETRQFNALFRNPIEKDRDNDRRILLTKRVKPFMLRRTKNEVVQELPPKTEVIRTFELQGAQRDLYEAIRMTMEKKVRDAIAKQGLNRSHIVLLDALLKLRQVCCDPRLVNLDAAKMAHNTSVKLEAFLEIMDNLMEEGRRVLVFSQFTSMLALIEEALNARQYQYLKLTGQTKNRHVLVDKFQQGAAPIFLISLKAGGTGLNLTKADTVIHYDPWWNPAVEDQATDRTHRIGQENPVFVYKLITQGTVEEAILAMQNRKRALFEGILADNAGGLQQLTDDDLSLFFRPLSEV